ncbi:hypothetical protein VNO77_24888 [Canavalia gladiata]|uniref:Uncharacterized protein n=1 Tax=Canavalia gladiata TaxID=3824 RepID=A0AAN9L754_CANGL
MAILHMSTQGAYHQAPALAKQWNQIRKRRWSPLAVQRHAVPAQDLVLNGPLRFWEISLPLTLSFWN